MTFIDLFAGIGGMRKGLELAGHKCVGFCEFDKFAVASYTSMHLITDEQREYLSKLPLKKRQKEILKEEYRNGEWYSNDIRNVEARSVPQCDCWCFGAPCQDFSVAGKRAGLDGDRSSLVREVFRILWEITEEDRPEWLIYENVKGMLSSNRGADYLAILMEMDELGYDIEWQNFNSKYYVPQNRERIYTIGHLRRKGATKILPITPTDGEDSFYDINQLGMYDNGRENSNAYRVYSADGISPALNTMGGGGREPHILVKFGMDYNVGGVEREVTNTIKARYDVGMTNFKQDGRAVAVIIDDLYAKREARVYEEEAPTLRSDRQGLKVGLPVAVEYKKGKIVKEIDVSKCLCGEFMTKEGTMSNQATQRVVIPVLTPERAEKRQNGRRFKENGDESFTLTAQDRHGVAIKVKEATKEAPDDVYVQLDDDCTVYTVWYDKYQCYIAIRKLTPKECFRLQGWSDEYFERAALFNSDSQLYKQAGNGVTVNVAYVIGEAISNKEKVRRYYDKTRM